MALQAVDPNSLTRRVLYELQCGHCMASSSANNLVLQTCCFGLGGAIPYAFSFCFPCSVIQSVVQAGEITVVISTLLNPCSSKVIRICWRITSIAGQPE